MYIIILGNNWSKFIIIFFHPQYIFNDAGFDKPFFSTYLKTSMFTLYLLGFVFWSPWRHQCIHSNQDESMYQVGESLQVCNFVKVVSVHVFEYVLLMIYMGLIMILSMNMIMCVDDYSYIFGYFLIPTW